MDRRKIFEKKAAHLPRSCADCYFKMNYRGSDLTYCPFLNETVDNFVEKRHQNCPLEEKKK